MLGENANVSTVFSLRMYSNRSPIVSLPESLAGTRIDAPLKLGMNRAYCEERTQISALRENRTKKGNQGDDARYFRRGREFAPGAESARPAWNVCFGKIKRGLRSI